MSKAKTKQPSTHAAEPSNETAAVEFKYITPSLRTLAVPIASLTFDPRNARQHGDKNRAAIRASLQKFGQQKPISVDADGIVLAGNGTLAEAQALGWTHIAIARSELRGAAARAFGIADNRTSELSTWDAQELTAQLEEIAAADVGVTVDDLGFDDAEVNALLNDLSGVAEKPDSIGRPMRTKPKATTEKDEPTKPRILIECDDEAEQEKLLEEFQERNLKFKSLPSL